MMERNSLHYHMEAPPKRNQIAEETERSHRWPAAGVEGSRQSVPGELQLGIKVDLQVN